MNTVERYDVLVVGAGISGLLAARALGERGLRVVVLDKGRGVGGRMATRRLEGGAFDHGAQFFTARDPQFQALVEEWLEAGLVKTWARGFALSAGGEKTNGEARYCGVAGMASIAKRLSEGLDLRLEAKVARVETADGGWRVGTETGGEYFARSLLLTSPAPQSLELLRTSGVELPTGVRGELEAIEYAPCLALLALLSGPCSLPNPGGMWCSGEPIAWMADNQRKGVSKVYGSALTIHAGQAFSREHWQTPEAEVTAALLAAASPWLGGALVKTQLHRWRYSQPLRAHAARCVTLRLPGLLAFAGDGFGSPRVEGAALSGLAAGAALVDLLR